MSFGETCASCRFGLDDPNSGGTRVTCVRYPPVTIDQYGNTSKNPVVASGWWCGEYRSIVPGKTKAEILRDFT